MKSESLKEKIANILDYNCEGCVLPKTISCVHPCVQQYCYADQILNIVDEYYGRCYNKDGDRYGRYVKGNL